MPDEQDEYVVAGLGLGRDLGEDPLHVVPAGAVGDPRIGVRLLAQVHDVVARYPEILRSCVHEGAAPLQEALPVRVVPAQPSDHEDMRLLCGDQTRPGDPHEDRHDGETQPRHTRLLIRR